MQATLPPWAWVTLERRNRARASAPDYRTHLRLLPRNNEDKYSIYGLRKDGRSFIRLDSLGKSFLLNRPWGASSAPATWRMDPFHDDEAWRGLDIKGYHPYEPVSIVLPASGVSAAGGGAARHASAAGGAGAGGAGAGSGDAGTFGGPGGGANLLSAVWSTAGRSWAAGALLLVLLLLLVRAAESCLQKRFFKAIYLHTNVGAGVHQQETMQGQYIYTANGVRRQESDEWSTPNVTATSLQDCVMPHLPACSPPPVGADPPPPYSACALHDKPPGEEPPPPYSDLCVAFSNPKDDDPTVHILSRDPGHPGNHPHTSIDIDNVQNDLIESGQRAIPMTSNSNDSETDSAVATELVFDNGRIIERVSIDVNGIDDQTTNEAGGSEHAGDAGKQHIVYIDEPAPADDAGRVLRV